MTQTVPPSETLILTWAERLFWFFLAASIFLILGFALGVAHQKEVYARSWPKPPGAIQ